MKPMPYKVVTALMHGVLLQTGNQENRPIRPGYMSTIDKRN